MVETAAIVLRPLSRLKLTQVTAMVNQQGSDRRPIPKNRHGGRWRRGAECLAGLRGRRGGATWGGFGQRHGDCSSHFPAFRGHDYILSLVFGILAAAARKECGAKPKGSALLQDGLARPFRHAADYGIGCDRSALPSDGRRQTCVLLTTTSPSCHDSANKVNTLWAIRPFGSHNVRLVCKIT